MMVLAWCMQCFVLLIAFSTQLNFLLMRTANVALCLVVRQGTNFSGTTGRGDFKCTKGSVSSIALAGRAYIPQWYLTLLVVVLRLHVDVQSMRIKGGYSVVAGGSAHLGCFSIPGGYCYPLGLIGFCVLAHLGGGG